MDDNKRKKPRIDGIADWLGILDLPNWDGTRLLGRILGWILVLAVPLLFVGALLAAGFVLYGTISDAMHDGERGATFGAGALIAAILGAPFVIWGTWIRYRGAQIQQEGHMTDRISRAVEQLGAEKTVKVPAKDAEGNAITVEQSVPNIEVRIGAILSLERIAQDSTRIDNGRDHVRVMEILCAYVRENSEEAHRQQQAKQAEDWQESEDDEWLLRPPKPRADIALALRVIGRRTAEQRAVEARWGPDAKETDEWVFDTPCPCLPDDPWGKEPTPSEYEAYRARLQDWFTHIHRYKGYRLDLRGANLQNAELSGLNLSGARLDEARLDGAFLHFSRLEGASLRMARAQRAKLEAARLQGAVLSEAQMGPASFINARLEGANLVAADLEGALLAGARMNEADLTFARMNGRTTVIRADITCAALKESDFSKVDFTQAQINSAFGDASVVLPEGITRPQHWPRWKLPDWGENEFDDQWRKWLGDPEGYKPPDPPGNAKTPAG